MPLYGRRTLGRPQIDTTSGEAVAGLIELAMQFVAQGASEKLRLKEKKEAQSLTLLSEQYRDVSNDLTRTESEYDTSRRLYEVTLGKVQPIDRTTGSDSVTDDLSVFYRNKIDEKQALRGRIGNRLNQNYSDLANIGRVQAGLATAVTPEMGDPKVYDAEDFSTKRLAKVFNVDPTLITRWRETQPEQIPSAIQALEKLRLVEGVKTKGVSQLELDRERRTQTQFIADRITNSPLFQDMDAIAKSDLNREEQKEAMLTLGKERGGTLSIIIDPAKEPQKGDSKKVQKKKREAQYVKVLYLHNTFNSFVKPNVPKDVVGLGNLISSLSHKAEVELKDPVEIARFKEYTRDYLRIDLDEKEDFMLPGYSLKKGVPVEKTESKEMYKHSAEEVIAYMWEDSGLPRAEFMADKEIMKKIMNVYRQKHPGITKEVLNKRITDAFLLLVGTEPDDTKVGV